MFLLLILFMCIVWCVLNQPISDGPQFTLHKHVHVAYIHRLLLDFRPHQLAPVLVDSAQSNKTRSWINVLRLECLSKRHIEQFDTLREWFMCSDVGEQTKTYPNDWHIIYFVRSNVWWKFISFVKQVSPCEMHMLTRFGPANRENRDVWDDILLGELTTFLFCQPAAATCSALPP